MTRLIIIHKLANESDCRYADSDKAAARKEANRNRMKKYRQNTDDEKAAATKEANRIRMRNYRHNADDETAAARLKSDRIRKREVSKRVDELVREQTQDMLGPNVDVTEFLPQRTWHEDRYTPKQNRDY